ncbi:MAG: hypothetical protein WDA21_05085 [Bacilli bacterium]
MGKEEKPKKAHNSRCGVGNGSIYGLGFIGAVIFFISNATSFWDGVLGFLKAIVWPAFMVYELFNYLLK